MIQTQVRGSTSVKTYNLSPIYDRKALIETFWPMIQEGLTEILKYTLQGADTTVLLNEIAAGRALLWVGFVDGKYAGFTITRIDVVGKDARELYIWHVYVKPEFGGALKHGLKELEQYGKTQKCIRMVFRTRRNSDALVRKLGNEWHEGYVEVYKKLGAGENGRY